MKEKLINKNQSVDKIFQIIEFMSESRSSMRLQDISKGVNYPPSTVLRLLNSLIDMGYAYQDIENSRYSLSLKFCKIGDSLKSKINIIELIHPYLIEISDKCDESVLFGIEQDMMVVYLDLVEGNNRSLKSLQRIGKSAPMHSTGIGKLLLLNYNEHMLLQLVEKKGLCKLTDKTITDLDSLKQELNKIRQQGYAIDDQECEIGTRCVSLPVRDYTNKIIGAISISGPTSNMTLDRVDYLSSIIQESIDKLSVKLGYNIKE